MATPRREEKKSRERQARAARAAAARRRRMIRTLTAFGVLIAVLALIAASFQLFGSSSKKSASTTSTTTSVATNSQKPVVDVSGITPPATLKSDDLKVGTGQEAKTGDHVTVQYVGVSLSTGKQFDASWDNGKPFDFTVGEGQVIKGWDQGIPGMKVGGERRLIIPPDLGYGAAGSPPAIAPNETLVFVVDLLSIS